MNGLIFGWPSSQIWEDTLGKNERQDRLAGMTQQATNMAPVVFVVDDDVDVRDGMRSLMRSVGLRCEVFASTREFLKQGRRHGAVR